MRCCNGIAYAMRRATIGSTRDALRRRAGCADRGGAALAISLAARRAMQQNPIIALRAA
jgi:hypothetical protein